MNRTACVDARQLIIDHLLNPYERYRQLTPSKADLYDPEIEGKEKEEIDPEIDFFLLETNMKSTKKYTIDEEASLNLEREEYWRRVSLRY